MKKGWVVILVVVVIVIVVVVLATRGEKAPEPVGPAVTIETREAPEGAEIAGPSEEAQELVDEAKARADELRDAAMREAGAK